MLPALLAVSATFLASFLASVDAASIPTSTLKFTFDEAAIIRARQWRPKYAKRPISQPAMTHDSGLGNLARRDVDETCPPAPLPTVACKSCTTCRDSHASYCAKPSNDPHSCGTCNSDKITCPSGSYLHSATCSEGKCGLRCASERGFTGPANACADTSAGRFVTCPAITSIVGYGLQTSLYVSEAPGSTTTTLLSCVYRARNLQTGAYLNTGGISCRYAANTGDWKYEAVNGIANVNGHPTVCPARIPPSDVTGSVCHSYRACASEVTMKGTTLPLKRGTVAIANTSPTAGNGGTLACYFQLNMQNYGTCTYSQQTLQPTSASFFKSGASVSVQPAKCPPLRADYSGYCSAA